VEKLIFNFSKEGNYIHCDIIQKKYKSHINKNLLSLSLVKEQLLNMQDFNDDCFYNIRKYVKQNEE
jgi:hypothetical protein